MASTHKFPPAKQLAGVFLRLMPWFAEHYDQVQSQQALEKGYIGPLEPFNAMDVENRVRYCFAKPGSKGQHPEDRKYGYSSEHHRSIAQMKPGGRGEVYARCSEEIERRIKAGEEVTLEEAMEWGKSSVKELS